MLVVVLLLVLLAGGALVSSVVTEHSQWAWVSVLFSVLGALVLVLRRSRRREKTGRRRENTGPRRENTGPRRGSTGAASESRTASTTMAPEARTDAGVPSQTTVALGQTAETTESFARRAEQDFEVGVPACAGKHADGPNNGGTSWLFVDPVREVGTIAESSLDLSLDEDPGDEGTDPRVLLQGPELDVEVVVVDERPRYHIERCPWLANRTTLPLSLREARELGFTPCALCAPNAVLTTRARQNRNRPTPS